jgi:hypothetical protein
MAAISLLTVAEPAGAKSASDDVFAEFVRLEVKVIVTQTAVKLSSHAATSLTPTVFALAANPSGTGLVAGLARADGSAAGMSVQLVDYRRQAACNEQPFQRRN